MEALDLQARPALHLQRLSPKASEQSIRNFLGGFNFMGDMALGSIENFSGGEKARLALAIVVWQKPNLLLLDEPTNHLDLEMCHALTVALQGFNGAVILVSHDRHLLRNTVDQLLLVHDGQAENFEGDLHDYSRWLLKGENKVVSGNTKASNSDKKQQRQQAAENRKQLQPLKKSISSAERKMDKNNQQLAGLEEMLADTELYSSDNKARLQQLLLQQGQLKQENEELEEHWLTLSDELEQLSD
jgi:ATP-binding cassette subfamily F protein 3